MWHVRGDAAPSKEDLKVQALRGSHVGLGSGHSGDNQLSEKQGSVLMICG